MRDEKTRQIKNSEFITNVLQKKKAYLVIR